MNKMLFGVWFCILSMPMLLSAQQAPPPDTSKGKDVELIYADLLEIDYDTKILTGINSPISLRQENVYFLSWKANINPGNLVTASRDVHIVQPDSVEVFADSLVYFGDVKLAKLFGDVSLSDSSATLFTDEMDYDMNTEIASYTTGGLIQKDSTFMSSQSGFYHAKTSTAYFKGRVEIVDPDFALSTDSLEYNARTDIAYFRAPTWIQQDSGSIYCEEGFYDTKNKRASFEKNAHFENPKKGQNAHADKITYDGKTKEYTLIGNAFFEDSSKTISADTIIFNDSTKQYTFSGHPIFKEKNSTQSIQAKYSFYDEAKKTMHFQGEVVMSDSTRALSTDTLDFNRETHEGQARGSVVWRDSLKKTTLICESANFNDSTNYLLATNKPLLISEFDGDSLYLAADTILSMPPTPGDSNRVMYAYHHVRFFKSDLQGRCDSLTFSTVDSTFLFYKTPILWADTTQFTADTLSLKMKNKQIQRVNLYNNSMIINNPDTFYYNQIKGDDIVANFSKNELRTMDVYRQGVSIYYVTDDKRAYTGVNKSQCERMLIYFGGNKVERIKFYEKPNATMSPMGQVSHKTMRLEGFKWFPELRPKTREDVYNFVLK